MRYGMTFYLNWYRNYERSKLNICFLLSKFQSFKKPKFNRWVDVVQLCTLEPAYNPSYICGNLRCTGALAGVDRRSTFMSSCCDLHGLGENVTISF